VTGGAKQNKDLPEGGIPVLRRWVKQVLSNLAQPIQHFGQITGFPAISTIAPSRVLAMGSKVPCQLAKSRTDAELVCDVSYSSSSMM
jgi:hypothetical protein